MLDNSRLDAEYFEPCFLQAEELLNEIEAKVKPLETLTTYITNGHTPRLHDLSVGDVVFLTAEHIDDFSIDFSSEKRILREHHEGELARTALKIRDVLVTIKGKVGNFAVVSSLPSDTNINQDVALLRVSSDMNPYYIVGFLNSDLGKIFTERICTGQINPFLSLTNLKRVPIPLFSDQRHILIGNFVEKAVQKHEDLLERSRALYAEAEALLLAELGLDDLDLSYQPTYKQSFSQVWSAGRLDAEHFQPKYYTLLDRLQKMGQAVRLGDWLREPVRRGVQPKYDENGTVIVINSQHVGKTHVELDDNRRTTKGFAEQNERAIVRPYDVLLNSTGYITIGRCQTFLDNVPAIVDGHVSIIRPKPGLDPVYLGLFLNSLPGQMQTERSWTGSSGQIELRSELVENYKVWKPDEALQRRIRRLVEDAHVARKKAKRLLEEAKRRVEEMVVGESG